MNQEMPTKWSVGEAPKVCTKCDFVDDKGFTLLIHPDVWSAIFYLCKEVKTEWQMLLTGMEIGQTVAINGYYIPKQEVTGSTVTNLEAIDKEFIESKDIVATIHSHSTMGVFFSNVDDEYTNMSWIKHHIVINNDHKYVAKSRYDLKCGGVKFVESTVETMIPTAKENAVDISPISQKKFGEYNSNGWNSGGYKSNKSYSWNENGSKSGKKKHQNSYYHGEEYVPWWAQQENAYIKVDGVWRPRNKVERSV